jgi:protein-S-isoprenylcysteine O-methyltransferase Ste14
MLTEAREFVYIEPDEYIDPAPNNYRMLLRPYVVARSALVTTGVQRFSRNPIYLGDVLLLAAWALWLHSITALIALPLFVAYITKFQIQAEEAALRSKFAEQFTNYCGSVRRWV